MRPTVKLWEIWTFIRWVSYKKWDLLPKRENGCISLLRSNNIQAELDLSELQYLNKNSVKNEQITQKWDILFCMSNWSPHLVWKNVLLPELENYSFGAFCSIFRKTNESVLSEYIAKYLQSWNYTSFITSLSRWAGINNLRGSDLENIEIPLPPLETQKAIVAKLDQIFAELDQTKSEIQKNLDNTDELWKSALNQAFQGDWEMKKLGEVATVQAWWTPSKEKKEYWENWDIPRLRSECCKNKSIYEAKEFISQSWFEHSSAKLLKKWTTLIALVWATIWKIAYLEFEATTNQNIAWIYPNDKNLDTKYLFNACLTLYKYFEKRWEWKFAMANLSFVKDLQIPVPPLSEQEKIVEHLDQVSKEVKALKSQYQSQLDNLEELKKSVLDKAFRWELGE